VNFRFVPRDTNRSRTSGNGTGVAAQFALYSTKASRKERAIVSALIQLRQKAIFPGTDNMGSRVLNEYAENAAQPSRQSA
jgi:hypothetical protein